MDRRDRLAQRVTLAMLAGCLMLWPATGAAAQDTGDAAVTVQSAAAQDLPSGRAVIDKFVQAIGGAEAVKAQKARRIRGRLEMPGQGISGDLEIVTAPPNRFMMQLVIPAIGEVRQGYDGETGWLVHPALGPMVMEGRMLEQLRQQADMHSPLYPERFIKAVETVERTEFGGRECFKVKVVTQWDEEYFDFFDVADGLLVGTIRTQASAMGDLQATSNYGDYREMDGLLVPTRTEVETLGMKQILTISEIVSAELGAADFALPAEIEALLPDEGAGAEEGSDGEER